jgi:hypothetical protein
MAAPVMEGRRPANSVDKFKKHPLHLLAKPNRARQFAL